ncbi:hypothetical protein EVAR_52343_1 [Eumeta japonica]|uniref:Uncharacterized protein n=1 Tax=Eumeta variegata TaxID=151549 RepID=A0A4C1Y5U1_EUMVA|nr:hypothetical protein EVAR_52343_1 [Eumeta japonica]
MADKDKDEAAIFTPRQSICRTRPSGVTILDDRPITAMVGKRPRESPGEELPPMRQRRDTEVSELVAEGTESALKMASKEELLGRAHESVRAIFGIVAGPGSKINKADTNSVASHGHNILAVMAALNLRLAEAELAVASAKSEAAKAISTGVVQAPATTTRSYAATLKLPGPERAAPERKKPSDGPMLAFYPVAEQSVAIKSAEETKSLEERNGPHFDAGPSIEGRTADAQGDGAAQPQTTCGAAKPIGRPTGEAVITALYEQNMRIKYPDWSLDRLKKSCRVAFKKSRREGSTTTVVLECEPELYEVLVTLDRAYIGWEAVPICDTVCGKCAATGHRLADCQSTVTRCATCHRFGRREAETHATASRDCPARRFAE